MKKADKILITVTSVILAITLFVTMPPFKLFINMGVMSVYSSICEKDGLTAEEGINIHIPGGLSTLKRDWFPFVMTFVPGEGFGYDIGQDTTLTILYNFPAFDLFKGCSMLYDEKSDYYSSFYGAYLVRNEDGSPYGFLTDEREQIFYVNAEEIAAVARYDFWNLVLSDFGLTRENAVFDFTVKSVEKDIFYLDESGWYKADATVKVNGCAHQKSEFVQSYLQYGIPAFKTWKPLAPAELEARMYWKYFPSQNVSIFFYIIAADQSVLEKTDREILSKSSLNIN